MLLINAKVSDRDEVNLNGENFYERNDIAIALEKLRGDENDYLLVVDVGNADKSYRGIGRLFYACAMADYPADRIKYKIEDGTLLTFDQMKARNERR